MTATAMHPPATARQRNEALWRHARDLFAARRVEAWLAHWQEDARWIAAYPVAGVPDEVEGRAALTATFGSLAAVCERIELSDVRFHQTDDPDVAIVEERFTADLVDGGRFENRLVMRVTFRDGLIAEMVEYYGQHALEGLLRRFGVTG